MARSASDATGGASAGSAVDRLRWLLTELPRQQAEAVVLCDVMGLSAAEAAQTLCLGLERLRRLLSAAHERLARLMSTEAA